MKRDFALLKLAASVLLAGSYTISAVHAEPAPARPNILLIMGDDMGYSDIGCFGGEAKTPHLDSLAAGGVRFTQFYNGARCCPTRASLLTGLYAHQTGMGHMTHHDRQLPGYRADLNNQCATVAEVLGDSGYRTYMVGKWHINKNEHPEGPKHNWPLQRGFEKYYGIIWGSTSFFDPAICRGNTWYSCENDPEYKPENFYLTDAFTDNAITFLKQHQSESPDKPFFMYAAYTAAHWPMHALQKDIDKYKGRFDAGYDVLRQERVQRLRKLGLMKPEWEVTPTAENWDQVKHREWELRCMEVYAAMIDSMDQGIGRIIAELKRQNQYDNTLIMFLQDNGACAEDVGRVTRKPRAGEKFTPLRPEQLPDGRQPKQTRDGRPVLNGPKTMPGGPDTYIAYGQAWANVSNTPFREYKHWVHEGGIATPLIAHWPAAISRSLHNGLVDTPAHIIDIMATCVDAGQTTYPAERKGIALHPMQGISLMPALKGSTLERKEPLFWEHEGNRAVRQGKWKLVAKEDEPWELYDMDADRTEMHNLITKEPAKARELETAWDLWAARANVLPLGGWKLEPEKSKPATTTTGYQRLVIKAGEQPKPEDTPAINDCALTVTVEIAAPQGDGVLVAQGGVKNGYAVYVQDQRPNFSLRQNGKIITIKSNHLLKKEAATVTAVLNAAGEMALLVDGVVTASRPSVGHLPGTPKEGISIGEDSGDQVGNYKPRFSYSGKLGVVTVETAPLS